MRKILAGAQKQYLDAERPDPSAGRQVFCHLWAVKMQLCNRWEAEGFENTECVISSAHHLPTAHVSMVPRTSDTHSEITSCWQRTQGATTLCILVKHYHSLLQSHQKSLNIKTISSKINIQQPVFYSWLFWIIGEVDIWSQAGHLE